MVPPRYSSQQILTGNKAIGHRSRTGTYVWCCSYPGQGGLSLHLAYWVEEELSKLEQRLEDERLEVVEEGSERARLTFNCSAAAVTYLFKLLVDEGVILEQNAMRVIRFIAEGFNTKRRSDLSEHAIHNHYYQERPVTVEKVREMLMGMYKRTR